MLARAQTCTSYKHHNMVEYLIGVTSQGTVSYISDGEEEQAINISVSIARSFII